jgi:hypothetical protein
MGSFSTKTVTVTPDMMRNWHASHDHLMWIELASVDINGESFTLSHSHDIERTLKDAMDQHHTVTITYREMDNMITWVTQHEKAL